MELRIDGLGFVLEDKVKIGFETKFTVCFVA